MKSNTSINVYTPETINSWNQPKTISLSKRKPSATANKKENQVEYLLTKLITPTGEKDPIIRIVDTQILSAPRNRNDPNNANKDFKATITLKKGDAKAFGTVCENINRDFRINIKEMVDAGDLVTQSENISSFYSIAYGAKTKKLDENGKSLAKKPRPEPVITIRLNFGMNPPNHPVPSCRNKPKLVIRDARTKYIDAENNTRYKDAVIERDVVTVDANGVEKHTKKFEPIDDNNVHEFITQGSTIVRGRLAVGNVSNSTFAVSIALEAQELIIMPGETTEFDDVEKASEEEIAEFNKQKQSINMNDVHDAINEL